MSILTATRPASNAKSRPLDVSLLLTIRETDYSVTPIAPGPDNVKGYRLEKLSGAREAYDLAHTNDGLVTCDCPSYVATHEGTISTCKHGSALVLMGLLPKPCCIPNARVETRPAPTAAPESEMIADLPHGRVVPAFDRSLYTAQNAVSEGRALWLEHRHLHAGEPLPATIVTVDSGSAPAEARQVETVSCCPDDEPMPCQGCLSHEGAADLSDASWGDDWRWELGPEADPATDPEVLELIEAGAYEQAEGEAPLEFPTPECFEAVATGRADWAREFGLVPAPGYVTRENAEDLAVDEAIGDGWAEYRDRERAEGMKARAARMLAADDATIATNEGGPDEPSARTLEEQVLDHARELRAIGSPLHDLLAERAEQLAAEIRYLDATTVGQYRDRRDAALDAARDAAEARMASRCCC